MTRSSQALNFRTDPMPKIHSLAAVDPGAILDDDVEIGPFCVVGPHVRIGTGTRLISHVSVTGDTTLGVGNVLFPSCVLGTAPQDKKYRGEPTRLVIGHRNQIREGATLHLGTTPGGGITRVGDNNLLMVNSHVGHDCQIGNNCILANSVLLAGHVVLGNNIIMSGAAACHHFVTVDDYAFVAGMARIHHDVPPFVKVSDDDKVRAINAEGLRRAGWTDADIELVEDAGRKLFFNREKPFATVLSEFDTTDELHPAVKRMVDFLIRRNAGKHGRYLEGQRVKKLAGG